MTTCLEQLDNDNWNGYDCNPNTAGTPHVTEQGATEIGPSFGFYKGNHDFEKHNLNGTSCYNICHNCLQQGIDNKQAVTTSCRVDLGNGAKCWMGFDYGK